MNTTVILGAGAVAASLPLLWWSIAGSRSDNRSAAENLRRGIAPARDLRQAALQQPAGTRVGLPLLEALATRARALTPTGWVARLEHKIVVAGASKTWTIEGLLALKLLLGVGTLVLGIMLRGGSLSVPVLMLVGVGAVAGFFFPDLLLFGRARDRQQKILLAIADTLDQVTISVEAGLGFESALARVARSGKGPLAEELARTLQDIKIGVPREQAFQGLVARTEVGELRRFVFAILQAERYGIPIADVLRVQSKEQRVKRRQRAEERAMKMPVKMVFPLVFCIFPTIFIVLVGPAAIQIARVLFNANI